VTTFENDRVRRVFARVAPAYDRRIRLFERVLGYGTARVWACGAAHGRVLEVGCGTGLNLPHYRADVELTAVDLSPEMLAIARRRAADLGRAVDLREADMTALPFSDHSFDTVVSTLTFCTVPDPVAAVREVVRVLAPGGEIRMVEHGAATNPLLRWGEQLLDPVFVRFEADHLCRRFDAILGDGGAVVHQLRRTAGGIVWWIIAGPASPL